MRYLYLVLCLIPIWGFSQTTETEDTFVLLNSKQSWKDEVQPVKNLGIEVYGNSGQLHQSDKTDLFNNNSFSFELYYSASIPNYNWISFGSGIEITGTSERDSLNGTVYDRATLEGYLFVFQAYMNVSPWFTLHFNSLGKMEVRARYTAKFSNPVSDNFGHFLTSELRFGLFITGNDKTGPEQGSATSGIDEFWITSPALQFTYYLQFHKNVAFELFGKLYVNNGLFYDSGITAGEIIPMEYYARFNFILGNGITLWTRVQFNVANSDFASAALFVENGFDVQIRAGAVFSLDFNSPRNI